MKNTNQEIEMSENKLTGMAAVDEKIKSRASLARELGITRGAISQWDEVPAKWLVDVSRITGLPVGVIRPDLFPSEA